MMYWLCLGRRDGFNMSPDAIKDAAGRWWVAYESIAHAAMAGLALPFTFLVMAPDGEVVDWRTRIGMAAEDTAAIEEHNRDVRLQRAILNPWPRVKTPAPRQWKVRQVKGRKS